MRNFLLELAFVILMLTCTYVSETLNRTVPIFSVKIACRTTFGHRYYTENIFGLVQGHRRGNELARSTNEGADICALTINNFISLEHEKLHF